MELCCERTLIMTLALLRRSASGERTRLVFLATSLGRGTMSDANDDEPHKPAAFDLPDGTRSESHKYPDRHLHILLITTGSVASVKAPLIVQGLLEVLAACIGSGSTGLLTKMGYMTVCQCRAANGSKRRFNALLHLSSH